MNTLHFEYSLSRFRPAEAGSFNSTIFSKQSGNNKGPLTRIIHESAAPTVNMTFLPGVLGP
jgi:hypothetical protein